MSEPAPAHHQRAQAHMTIDRVLRKMRRDDHDLAARAAVERPDGYPSGGNGGGGKGGVSDPTGRTVVQRDGGRDDGTRARRPATEAIALTMQAAALLARADSLRASALPPRVEPKEADDWCTNCEKAKELSPRGDVKAVGADSTLCTWCHAFQREHGMLPPRALVRKHARGERIYTRDIVAALQALQPAKAAG
jgi:hypothetical protein